MKKQEKRVDVEKILAKTEKMSLTIEQLRNENHNLKRQLKRRDAKLKAEKEIASSTPANISKVDEVTSEGIEDIKKKLRERGLTEKEIEVAVLFISRVTGM